MKTLPTLYHRTAKGSINQWTVSSEAGTVYTEWGERGGAIQKSFFLCEEKNFGKKNFVSVTAQAEKEALALWEKKKRTKYSEEVPATSDYGPIELLPMLAKKWEDHKKKVQFPAFSQPKLDGLRSLCFLRDGKIVLQSRGNKFYSLPHLEAELAPLFAANPDLVLDGELYKHGVSLQTINSLVRKPRKESEVVEYHVYDLVMEGGFAERKLALDAVFNSNVFNFVVQVPTVTVNSEDQVVSVQADLVAQGYEGSMVRTADGEYRAGYRSADLLKVKLWMTDEFPIVGHKVGKGRFENVPMIICALPNGDTFDCTPVGTMEERKALLDNIQSYIGKPYTVKYFGLSPYGVPLYPNGISVRFPEDMP